MQTQDNADAKRPNGPSFILYASQRMALAVIIIIALVGGAAYTLHYYNIEPAPQTVSTNEQQSEHAMRPTDPVPDHLITDRAAQTAQKAEEEPTAAPSTASPLPPHLPATTDKPPNVLEAPKPAPQPHVAPPAPQTPEVVKQHQAAQPPVSPIRPVPTHPPESHPVPAPAVRQPPPHAPEPKHTYRPAGVAFVEALVQPIDSELNQRFWGWRPNDIINPTDNVNNMQLAVLEVTRRTTVQLTERISRTGSTDAHNQHLQNAMNWFMVKADRYWFPAPESKFKESLQELEQYKQQLINGKASFYTRTDNLIPLLMAFEDLLGSCDENLVKLTEMDGSEVSLFKADDYFYYAKGVAGAMAVILEAIHHDFAQTLENRNGSDLLHHAITSCKMAAELSPWLITDSDLDGIFANHRANMAAPISHARFYIGQLIKTLST